MRLTANGAATRRPIAIGTIVHPAKIHMVQRAASFSSVSSGSGGGSSLQRMTSGGAEANLDCWLEMASGPGGDGKPAFLPARIRDLDFFVPEEPSTNEQPDFFVSADGAAKAKARAIARLRKPTSPPLTFKGPLSRARDAAQQTRQDRQDRHRVLQETPRALQRQHRQQSASRLQEMLNMDRPMGTAL